MSAPISLIARRWAEVSSKGSPDRNADASAPDDSWTTPSSVRSILRLR